MSRYLELAPWRASASRASTQPSTFTKAHTKALNSTVNRIRANPIVLRWTLSWMDEADALEMQLMHSKQAASGALTHTCFGLATTQEDLVHVEDDAMSEIYAGDGEFEELMAEVDERTFMATSDTTVNMESHIEVAHAVTQNSIDAVLETFAGDEEFEGLVADADDSIWMNVS
jgi:hypothetical protein